MLELSFEEILRATNGEIIKNPEKYEVEKVSTDTRKIEEKTLFIALKGDRFNGNTYVVEAFNKGANLCIVDEVLFNVEELPSEVGVIKVDNTRIALMELAKFYREKLGIKVIGVTGSAGKTSTKDLLAALLSYKFNVFKTKGNFNNDIGLPLMILELNNTYDIAILEMGMSDLKEIEKLAEIASPDMGVITNIGLSHIENLKTRDNILKAKMEITTYFNNSNILVVNGNDDMLDTVYSDTYKLIKTGVGEEFSLGAKNIVLQEFSSKFTVYTPEEEKQFLLDMPGQHNIGNLMLGICIGRELGLTLEEMSKGLNNLEATSMRLELFKKDNFTIINDCYNSSPSSVISAIDVILNVKGNRKICVLGTMRELGDESAKAHREIGTYAKNKNVDLVLCCGDFSENIAEGFGDGCKIYIDKESLMADLENVIKKDDIILVKASRSMKFEEITKKLMDM